MSNPMPTYDALMNPLLEALRQLGGSASVDEIQDKVIELERIDEDVQQVLHAPDRGNMTEVGYRLAWARTYLKKCGYLVNSSRGVWSLTPKGRDAGRVTPKQVKKLVRELDATRPRRKKTGNDDTGLCDDEEALDEAADWRAALHEVLTRRLSPDAFERLVQRLLRESGFIQVEVTGRTGDGGIDGKGIAKIHGFMSFHVIFQCKRYQGSVSASAIRDFRGAMVGRADKGLFITTGSFTPAAVKEATRDGAPPIDLVDGEELADKLKALGLGIRTEMVEEVTVEPEWFEAL